MDEPCVHTETSASNRFGVWRFEQLQLYSFLISDVRADGPVAPKVHEGYICGLRLQAKTVQKMAWTFGKTGGWRNEQLFTSSQSPTVVDFPISVVISRADVALYVSAEVRCNYCGPFSFIRISIEIFDSQACLPSSKVPRIGP